MNTLNLNCQIYWHKGFNSITTFFFNIVKSQVMSSLISDISELHILFLITGV